MVTSGTKHLAGYLVLATGVVVGLFAAFLNDSAIKDVNNKQTTFIVRQCDREKLRNGIAVGFLERDRSRVEQSNIDLAIKRVYLETIDEQIRQLNNIPPCRLP